MCMYCSMGDHTFRYDPPWYVPPSTPYVPAPVVPTVHPWDLERLREYYDLLKGIKELEDKLGCPCEPNKADYLTMFKNRIAELEAKEAAAKREGA